MGNFDIAPMTRKPVQSPKPAITRAPAKTRNPMTTEVMQRVRRVIVNSQGQITSHSIADELGFGRRQFDEWLACWRATPTNTEDALLKIIRWLVPHDLFLVPEVFTALNVKFRGEVSMTRKLSDSAIAKIRASEEPIAVLAFRYDVHETMISKIRNGSRY